MLARTSLLAVLVAVAAPVADAQTTKPAAAVIGPGIVAGGVDLAGLTVTAAAAKLKAQAGPHVIRPLSLAVGGRRFHLSAGKAQLRLNALATAKAALAAPPAPDNQGGGTVAGTLVPLVVSHSYVAVATFVRRVSRTAAVAPRNATLKYGVRHMTVVRARVGHTLDTRVANHLINTALNDPDASHAVRVAVIKLHPKINADDLRAANPTIVTVDRAHFTLRLFTHLKIARRYPIAVGRAGLETPTGVYHVQDKQVNPSWHVPNSAWAGALAGHVIPPGPADPIVARWMGLASGVGIHGTNEPWTVGSAASHGCIRMRVPDVIALFERVPMGTPVLIR